MTATQHNRIARPPVVSVMGHIDHGKSTLLDYIRKTRVVEEEAGGITQHLSAYEVTHKDEGGTERRITFLDTPGHAAFQHLRSRGSSVADLAILVVSAEDGAKPQTLEALEAITDAGIPYLVAITKIDKPNANVERAKASLLENGIYLEGLGGSVPFAPLSSKTGEGVDALLDLLLLAADLEELTADPSVPATGLVIESHCDPKKGISAALIIKDGTLHTGGYVVAGHTFAPLRMIEDFKGKKIGEATFSSPITVIGFSDIPPVGATFTTVKAKKEAEVATHAHEESDERQSCAPIDEDEEKFTIPVVIKADVVGSLEAIRNEVEKQADTHSHVQIVREGVGAVTEGDIKQVGTSKNAIIIGFNVGVDSAAEELAERMGLTIGNFAIIYELISWLGETITSKRPRVTVDRVRGVAKILKSFSRTKQELLVGGRVESGSIVKGYEARLIRNGEELDRTTVGSLKHGKSSADQVHEGDEFGLLLTIEHDLVHGDVLECIEHVEE